MIAYIRISPPFTAFVVQGRSRKEQDKDSESQQENRPVDEHRVRSRLLKVQPHDEALEKNEEAW